MALYITGHMNQVLSPEHQKEIKRYIYNHQVPLIQALKKTKFYKQNQETLN